MNDETNFAPTESDPLLDRLMEQYQPLTARVDELTQALARVPEKIDDATIDRAAAFVKQIKLAAKDAEVARKAEGDDFLKAKRTVDSFFASLAETLKKAAETVERRVQAYLTAKADAERRRREAEAKAARVAAEAAAAEARRVREAEETARRLAEEEARKVEAARVAALKPSDDALASLKAQQAAEELAARQEDERRERELVALQAARRAQEEADAAQREAEAKAADMARTRGALGGVATLATSLDFEITDRVKAALSLARFMDDAAIDKAARALIRTTRDQLKRDVAAGRQTVDGVRFFEAFKARVA